MYNNALMGTKLNPYVVNYGACLVADAVQAGGVQDIRAMVETVGEQAVGRISYEMLKPFIASAMKKSLDPKTADGINFEALAVQTAVQGVGAFIAARVAGMPRAGPRVITAAFFGSLAEFTAAPGTLGA